MLEEKDDQGPRRDSYPKDKSGVRVKEKVIFDFDRKIGDNGQNEGELIGKARSV